MILGMIPGSTAGMGDGMDTGTILGGVHGIMIITTGIIRIGITPTGITPIGEATTGLIVRESLSAPDRAERVQA